MIQPVGPDDAERIAALERATSVHPWSGAAVASTLALPTTRAWLAWDGPRPVGHLLATVVADAGEVLTTGVLPEARRRGWGTRLIAACQDHWREAGVTRAFLEVRSSNLPAIGLYEQTGWRQVGIRRGYYADGEDALLMCWEP